MHERPTIAEEAALIWARERCPCTGILRCTGVRVGSVPEVEVRGVGHCVDQLLLEGVYRGQTASEPTTGERECWVCAPECCETDEVHQRSGWTPSYGE